MAATTRFIVVSTYRSGNNLLQSLLNSHPDILCREELFRPSYMARDLAWDASGSEIGAAEILALRTADPAQFLSQHAFVDRARERRIVGFRLFYDQPGERRDEVWEAIRSDAEIRIIDLRRANALRRFVSGRQAGKTGVFVKHDRDGAPPPEVSVDPQVFMSRAKERERDRERALAFFAGHKILSITYEDLVSREAEICGQVLDFLGAKPWPLRARTLVQNTETLRATISNYAEVAAALAGTPYAWMLDDDQRAAARPRPVPAFRPRADGRLTRAQAGPRQAKYCLFAQVGSADLDILPHWFAHYRRLGVTGFRIVIHEERRHGAAARIAAVSSLCRAHGAAVAASYEGKFSEAEKCRRLTAEVRRFDGEWVLIADADEFLELPFPSLPATIRALELCGGTALYATMVQRIAADGRLAPLPPDGDPDRVYGLAAPLLLEAMGVTAQPWKSKYPLFRVHAGTEVRFGHHLAPDLRPAETLPVQGVVHHYKWRPAVRSSLARRARAVEANAPEVRAYGDYLRRHSWKLPRAGAFAPSRPALLERGLLRRPTRAEIARQSLTHRLVLSRDGEGAVAGAGRLALRLAALGERWAKAAPWAADLSIPRDAGALAGPPARILFVTFQLAPIDRTGGIGTWVATAAQTLARAGHRVTIAYAPLGPSRADALWQSYWEAHDVELVVFDALPQLDGELPRAAAIAGSLVKWLRGRAFDVIHLHDVLGYGAAICAARRQGILDRAAQIVVTAHGPTVWHYRGNGYPLGYAQVRLGEEERRQMAEADCLVAPTRHLLSWLPGAGFALPDRRHVHPNPILPQFRAARIDYGTARPVRELVFFGRIEPRKGLDMFCEAVERVARRRSDFRVTFLGQCEHPANLEAIEQRRAAWKVPSEVITEFRPETANLYLREPGRLAVMPSLRDNLPYTVLECLAGGIPFVSTRIGGIPEMIHADDAGRVLVAPDPGALADALAAALDRGWAPARPSFDYDDAELQWIAWHGRLAAGAARESEHPAEPRSIRLLAVCALECAGADSNHLGAFEAQGRALAGLAISRLAPEGAWDPETINPSVRRCDADALLFAGPNTEPLPNALDAMTRAIDAAGAHAVVCGCDVVFVQSEAGALRESAVATIYPGGPSAFAPFENIFGGPCFMIRRAAFDRIGGFAPDPVLSGVRQWELLGRLALCGGRIETVPLALYRWSVRHEDELAPTPAAAEACLRRLTAVLPVDMAPALELVRSYVPLDAQTKALRERARDLRLGPELEREGRLVQSIESDAELRTIEAAQHIEPSAGPGLSFIATGEDPILLLPARALAAFGPSLRHLVQVRLTVPFPTRVQLFWRDIDGGFSEAHSVSLNAGAGDNTLNFMTPPIAISSLFRLDPGARSGRYALHWVKIWIEPGASAHARHGALPRAVWRRARWQARQAARRMRALIARRR